MDLIEIWNSMKPASRVRSVILGSIIVLAAIATAMWALSEKYETLFSSMEPQDAAAVISELERMGITYQLGEEGTRISVPSDKVHELRVKLMGSSLPLRGGVGFEIFDETGFGMTEFTQKINYQRALEGELSRTISSLKEVKYARVHLVMPETSLFHTQNVPPSASITLFLKQGSSLDEPRILGLQRLVSAAVQGLDLKHVTVTDQNGMTLSRTVEEDEESLAITSRLKKKSEIESYFSSKVIDVLDRALGHDRAVVSVDVSLNMNQVRTTREEVIPHGDPQNEVLHRRESKSNNGQSSTQSGNVVTEVEYQLGRKVEQIVATPGAIERLSVGVLVPNEIASQRLEEIRSLVAMAVGLNAERGDSIAVFASNFHVTNGEDSIATDQPANIDPGKSKLNKDDQELLTAKSAIWDPKTWRNNWQTLLALAASVFFLLMLFTLIHRRPRKLRPEERVLMLKRLEQWSRAEVNTLSEKGQL